MTQTPRAEPGINCPLLKQDMSKVCHKCAWWMQMRGQNPNTGQDIDQWGCAVQFLPMLLAENAKHMRGAAAATEDARNNIVDAVDASTATLGAVATGNMQEAIAVSAQRAAQRLLSRG